MSHPNQNENHSCQVRPSDFRAEILDERLPVATRDCTFGYLSLTKVGVFRSLKKPPSVLSVHALAQMVPRKHLVPSLTTKSSRATLTVYIEEDAAKHAAKPLLAGRPAPIPRA